MGSSAKKKKEKRKDFQKPKLKVGKTKAKAANFTDTSFKAKSIVLTQQSLTVNAPGLASQFDHYLSLANHKSDSQRRDALAFLTTAVLSATVGDGASRTAAEIVPKVKNLICDRSAAVRAQTLKLFQALPRSQLAGHEQDLLLWIQVGMTHMSKEIRLSALDFLSWLLSVSAHPTVSGAGAWYKTIRAFLVLLKWNHAAAPSKVGTSGQPSGDRWSTVKIANPTGDAKEISRTIQVFAEFLWAGLEPPDKEEIAAEQAALARAYFPLRQTWLHMMPQRPNAFAHLHLFGAPPDEENAMYESQDDRLEFFSGKFRDAVGQGMKWARNEQGEVGRAARSLEKVLRDASVDFEA